MRVRHFCYVKLWKPFSSFGAVSGLESLDRFNAMRNADESFAPNVTRAQSALPGGPARANEFKCALSNFRMLI